MFLGGPAPGRGALALLACGGGETQPAGEGEGASRESLEEAAPEPVADTESSQGDDEIDPESLSDSGTVLIEQYQGPSPGCMKENRVVGTARPNS